MGLPRGIVDRVFSFVDVRKALQVIRLWMPYWHQHNPDQVPTETIDGVNKSFSTEKKFVDGSLMVFYNGVLQYETQVTADADRLGYTFVDAPLGSVGAIQHHYIVDLGNI